MARNVPQFIDVPRGPKKASGAKELTIVPSGEAPGAFENISVASVWLNTKGDKVYIKGDTSIEITPADKSDVRGPVEQLFGSPEEVKAFLKEQGYAFSHVRGGEREGTSFTGSLESEGTGETKAQLDEQIADLIENIDSKKQAINSAINKANELSTIEGFESMRSILDEISKQTEELLWQVNKISLEDDKLDSSENDLDFTLKEKLKNKNSLNQIEEDLATLLKNAQVTLESLKKLASVSSDTSGEGATPPTEGAGQDAKDGADTPGDKKGGPEGPEGPEFGLVIAELKTKVEGIINAITTPKEFGEFRKNMVRLPSRDSDRTRYLFFRLDDIKAKVNRVISDDELGQVKATEKWLASLAERKFDDLKSADFDVQYRQAQEKIIATHSEADAEILEQTWVQSPAISIAEWQDVLHQLLDTEKQTIEEEVRMRTEMLKRELNRRRRGFIIQRFTEQSGGKEKLALLESVILDGYEVYRKHIHKAVGGRISTKERQELWDQKGGEKILEDAIVRYLQAFSGMNPDEGSKLFRVIIEGLRPEEN